MLTGRLGLACARLEAVGLDRLAAAASAAAVGPPAQSAAWTTDAAWLPATAATIELRYRDPTRMGKIYVVPRGASGPSPAGTSSGRTPTTRQLDLATWRARIQRHRGEFKNLLREQSFVAGIGNGYSDEILWTARLAPFRKRSTLAPEEVDRLYDATKDTLAWAIDELRHRVPPDFEVEVRDFLHVHRKGGEPCPRCGTTISEIAPGGFVTSFCRGCQR